MNPVLCRIDGLPIAAYGVLVALGYFVGTLFLHANRERMHMTVNQFWILCYTILAGAVVGAKGGYFLVEWRSFAAEPLYYLRDWRNGWVFWTGFAGTLAAAFIYQRTFNRFWKPRKLYLPPADYFGAALPLGHTLGRLGCFLEGCCHGRPTSMPWGVRFTDPGSSVDPSLLGVPLHPVQLYEAAGELAISLFVMAWVLPRIRAGKLRYGTAFFGYIGAYAALRFVMEGFRGDDRGIFLSAALSPSQWWSLAALAVAGAALWRNGVRETKVRPLVY